MLETSHIGRSRIHDRFLVDQGLSRLDPRDAMTDELRDVRRLSVQFPGEHCTECAAPDCHDSCDLFERGCTGRCRRFVGGIVLSSCALDLTPYCMEVLFKPWGQLFCIGNAWCVDRRRQCRLTRLMALLGRVSMVNQSAFRWLPSRAQWRLTDRIRGAGNKLPRYFNGRADEPGADELLCVVGHPGAQDVTIELSVSGIEDSQDGRSLRRTFTLKTGWNTLRIPIGDIRQIIDLKRLFRVGLVPLIEQPTFLQVLYFGFVVYESQRRRPEDPHPSPLPGGEGGEAPNLESRINESTSSPKVKLLVTDLDNTLWDGILVEDPDREYKLRPGVRDTLTALDERGILLSIASKNNPEDAEKQLRRLDLWDLFLHPRITWDPKSEGIRRIVEALNIGMDTVAFIDDSEFERAEVTASLPAVRAFGADAYASLPDREEFTVPVTEESRRRRNLYREEQVRASSFEYARMDYDVFLASCDTVLSLEEYTEANRDRVLELVQRTNQLNFSGNRYTRESLESLLAEADVVPVVMRCCDRFGDYGIIGFAILSLREDAVEITDLMFSCRVQGKKVEHAFLSHVIREAEARGCDDVRCSLKETARNRPATRVFSDLGFESKLDGELTVVRITLPAVAVPTMTWPVSVHSSVDMLMDRNPAA